MTKVKVEHILYVSTIVIIIVKTELEIETSITSNHNQNEIFNSTLNESSIDQTTNTNFLPHMVVIQTTWKINTKKQHKNPQNIHYILNFIFPKLQSN